MSKYLTQGTVQISASGPAVSIKIVPTANYSTKVAKQDYVIFEQVNPPGTDNIPAIFKKTSEKFSISPGMITLASSAAVMGCLVEIGIEDDGGAESIVVSLAFPIKS